jgi:hypothetical protein
LLLRAQAGEPVGGAAQWWTDYIGADELGRTELIESSAHDTRPPRRRRRRRSNNTGVDSNNT